MSAGIDADPHQARHWYVTMAIRTIYETAHAEGEVQRRLRELVEYMKWKSGSMMIDVYQHYFDAQRHAEVQDKVHDLMEQSKKLAMTELKCRPTNKFKKNSLNQKIPNPEPKSDVQDILADMLGGDLSAD